MDEWVLKLKNDEEGESSLACNPVGSLLKIQIEDHLPLKSATYFLEKHEVLQLRDYLNGALFVMDEGMREVDIPLKVATGTYRKPLAETYDMRKDQIERMTAAINRNLYPHTEVEVEVEVDKGLIFFKHPLLLRLKRLWRDFKKGWLS
jgi:hypothetical protein